MSRLLGRQLRLHVAVGDRGHGCSEWGSLTVALGVNEKRNGYVAMGRFCDERSLTVCPGVALLEISAREHNE